MISKQFQNQPFELHSELAYQIKLALDSRGWQEPQVRIDLPFDKLLFEGGLKQLGKLSHSVRRSEVNTIGHYKDLNLVLGINWDNQLTNQLVCISPPSSMELNPGLSVMAGCISWLISQQLAWSSRHGECQLPPTLDFQFQGYEVSLNLFHMQTLKISFHQLQCCALLNPFV